MFCCLMYQMEITQRYIQGKSKIHHFIKILVVYKTKIITLNTHPSIAFITTYRVVIITNCLIQILHGKVISIN